MEIRQRKVCDTTPCADAAVCGYTHECMHMSVGMNMSRYEKD